MRYLDYVPLGIRQKMILHCFWDNGGYLSGTEVAKLLKETYDIPLSKSATNTMIKTLVTRGYVELVEKKSASNYYRTTIDKETLLQDELKWMQENDYNGSAKALLINFLKANVDDTDLECAREILAQYEDKG